MRFFVAGVVAWATFVAVAALAQSQGPPIKINQVRVGFRSYVADEAPGRFKVGMWTPVYIDLQAGPLGLSKADLLLETADSENVATVFTVPIGSLVKDEQRTILAFTKPGNSEGRFTISVRVGDRNVVPSISSSHAPMRLAERLYVTLGTRVGALQDALVELRQQRGDAAGQNPDPRDSFPRYAAFERDPKRLPTLALGYDGVDLMFLTTGEKEMLDHLNQNTPRLKAIAEWVRQGGRLVVSCSWANQQFISKLFQSPAWQPPLPVIPPADAKERPVDRLASVETWGHITDKPFPARGQKPLPIALLEADAAQRPKWEVEAETADGRALIGTMGYGRGQITLLAFDLDKGPFTAWKGGAQFLKTLVSKLEPRVAANLVNDQNMMFDQNLVGQDLASQLQITLDQFDVPIIPFGWVALFIIVYILIVGPLDYIILKKVFNRLEGTWITFPAVVLAVSVVAYFTAYAVKGRDLKINKIDLVDIDLRTDLDGKYRPRKAYAYGNTWFTIMSPRIQSYTIGIEPVLPGWWGADPNQAPASADVVSWLGRPETDGPGAMGRPRAQGWSHRSYAYEPDATGLSGVPIPVWTTKSFAASWESPLPRLPIEADFVYYFNHEKEIKLTGTIKSFLPADLEDVWILYRDRAYPLRGPLRGSQKGGEPRTLALASVAPDGEAKTLIQGQGIQDWQRQADNFQQRPSTHKGIYDPTTLIKKVLFHVQVDSGGNSRNQALHRLDLSWRLQKEPNTPKSNIRDVILYGRVAPAVGDAEDITRNRALPTHLWLGDVPGPNKTRPSLVGNLTQDTYIRVLMSAKPAQ